MRELLEAMGLEDRFAVESEDDCTLRCRACGAVFDAGTADLHVRYECPQDGERAA